MKHTKQLLMMLVIVFLLVGLTTLAATDVTHNDTNVKKSTDISKTNTINKDHIETQPAETKTSEKQNQLQKTPKENNKKQDVTPINISNFNEFSNAIKNGSQSTKILNITEGFTLGDNLVVDSGITSLTINGNQKTIYGNNYFRFLTINNGQTVELNNLNIINCFRITDGGAIQNNGNLTITNCNLSNNKADDYCGGAIANGETGRLYIENSNLTNNFAEDSGGAIDNNGIAIITGSNLSNNTANRVGGAVMNYRGKTLNITNSTLSYNKADDGGAIRNSGNLIVAGSNFTDNYARLDGGALSNSPDNVRGCKISDTLFYNNNKANFIIDENNHIQLVMSDDFITVSNFTIITDVQTYQGNGLEELRQYTIPKESINVKLLLNGTDMIDNTFIIRGTLENPAPVNISNYDELVRELNDTSANIKTLNITEDFLLAGDPTINASIKLLIIEGNQKTINGIRQYRFLTINEGQSVIINNLNLIHCSRLTDGGAIVNNGYLIINNTNLTNHTSDRSGGAIANGATGTLYIINSNLTNNTAKWNNGGAVDNDGVASIIGSNLTNNYAFTVGGAVMNYRGKTLNITNSSLSYNRADDGAAIGNTGNLIVAGSNFTNNTARLSAGAVFNSGSTNVSDTIFNNNNPANFIIDENNHIKLVDDDDFISVGDFTIITDYQIYHGNGPEELGKIIIPREAPNVKLLLNGTNAIDNTFIIKETPEKIVPTNISNFVELRTALNDGTEFIKILNITADITMGGNPTINSNIKMLIINGNQHTIDGDKLFQFLNIANGQNVIINNLTVIRCHSSDDGGAIHNEGNLTIIYSILNNNTAPGGAAIGNIYGGNLTIISSTLNYNNVTTFGGAIANDGKITVIDSALNYNCADRGGVVYNYLGSTINITNSDLTHNSANSGGAIFNYGNIIISDSYIAYNKANSVGGAIYEEGTYKISDTTFFQNTPENFIINENDNIQLIHADNFVSVGDFRLIIDDESYTGNGAEQLGQYIISREASTIRLILNGTNTTDNAFYLKGNPGPIDIKNYEDLATALNDNVESIKILNITADIVLKSNLTVNSSITNLTIIGNQKIIDGNGLYRFLNITNGQNVIINNLTITNCYSANEGGAIVNEGNLTIIDSNLNNNNASWLGGAVHNNKGNLTIINSNITNNKVNGNGGAINNNEGNLTIIESNISYNNAQNAGAIYNYGGLMNITYSNITNNKANSERGALWNNGRCSISDTFFYNNTPANFIVDENNHIQLVNDDDFISINDFIIVNDYELYQGTGRDMLEQYTVPKGSTNVKLLLNGTNTTDNMFIIKGDDEIINSEKTRLTNENPASGGTTDIIASFIVGDTPIAEGMVIFKLNGKTLRDDDGKVIYVNINEGAAKLENVLITNAWVGEETTLQAIFIGNDEFEPMYTDKLIFSVSNREAQVEITAPSTAQAGETITLSASVTSGGVPVTTGRVTFKLNGKTLKDEDGKALYVDVENGLATTPYTLPAKIKEDTYTLKAVFADNSYQRCEKETQLTVTKQQ